MTIEISELMDGERDVPGLDSLVGRVRQDSRSKDDWNVYHLIGDTLRRSEFFSPGLVESVGRRLAEEPTVLAPRRGPALRKTVKWSASAAAAALAAIAVVVWVGFRGAPEPAATQIATLAPPGTPVQPAAQPVSSRVNDYLIAHQEYSPRTAMQGVASHVQSVSYPGDGPAR